MIDTEILIRIIFILTLIFGIIIAPEAFVRLLVSIFKPKKS